MHVLIAYTVNPTDFLPMLSMAGILGPLSGAALHRGAPQVEDGV
jgi:hypothetical protein